MKLVRDTLEVRLGIEPSGRVGLVVMVKTAERIVLAPTQGQLAVLAGALGAAVGRALMDFDFAGAWEAIRLDLNCRNLAVDHLGRVTMVVPRQSPEGRAESAETALPPDIFEGPTDPAVSPEGPTIPSG